jgi:hypothetical protein
MDIFKLYRNFWDFAFENPEKIKPNHIAIYSFAIEHCNRLGWKKKFGLPSTMTMEAVGIKSYNTYISAFNDLVEFGFIELVEKSKNQYSSNIIALSKFDKANNKALDKALIKHTTKQSESTGESISSIDIQETSIQETNKQSKEYKDNMFEIFWNLYDNKKDRFACYNKFVKLDIETINKIIQVVPEYLKTIKDKQFQKHPKTWINNKCWNDEYNVNKNTLSLQNAPQGYYYNSQGELRKTQLD